MALNLRRFTFWSQVYRRQPNPASRFPLTKLSPVISHKVQPEISFQPYNLPRAIHRPVSSFLGSSKKVNLTPQQPGCFSTCSCCSVNKNISKNNNCNSNVSAKGIRTKGILISNNLYQIGLFYLGLLLDRFRLLNFSPVVFKSSTFRTWELSNSTDKEALQLLLHFHFAKQTGDMSNLNVDMTTSLDNKKSPSSGSDSPDNSSSPGFTFASTTKATTTPLTNSPQGLQEDIVVGTAPPTSNEREQQQQNWKVKKERYLKESLEVRKNRCKFGKCNQLADIETWPEYYFRKESEIKDDRKSTKGSLKLTCPELNKKVSIWKGDITSLLIDAIVNAANESLMGGGGVDGAIHSASGKFLKRECMTLKPCPTGNAVITGGYELPAKYVIHTVGPRGEDPEKLKNCYENSLKCLLETDLKSIAFPCVSTGIYGYPNDKAAEVVLKTVRKWLESNHEKVERVIFCLFLDKDIHIYEEKMQQYFPISSNETGKEEAKLKADQEM